jgi:hypothetical protein
LEELTRFICLLTTLQLLRFLGKEDRWFPTGDDTYLELILLSLYVCIGRLLLFLCFGRYRSDLCYYKDSTRRCQAKMGRFPSNFGFSSPRFSCPIFLNAYRPCGA